MRRLAGEMMRVLGLVTGLIGALSIPTIPILVIGLVWSGALDEIGLGVLLAAAAAPFVLIPMSLLFSFLGLEFTRPLRGDCIGCGYDLRGLHGRICPECGTGF